MHGSSSTTVRRTVPRTLCASSPALTVGSVSSRSKATTKPARGRSSVRAFNAGVIAVPRHPDLVTGLDADVSFGPEYFDALRREFERNPRLGIAAGLCYEPCGDGWEPVYVTHPNLRGASFTYRRECLAQLLPLEERLRLGRDRRHQGKHSRVGNSDLPRPELLPPPSDRCSRCQPVRELSRKKATPPTTCGTGLPT